MRDGLHARARGDNIRGRRGVEQGFWPRWVVIDREKELESKPWELYLALGLKWWSFGKG